jgi:type II secretory pathway predicted ATPase ExeA
LSGSHREALAALEWGLLEPSGFTMLVGEPGTGKTTLIHSLLARGQSGVRIAFVTDANLKFLEIMRIIVSQFGITPEHVGKLELIEALDRFVTTRKTGESVAIIIDEAQDLSDGTLEELRLLSNPRSLGNKPLKIVLVGQPELQRRLENPKLKQVNQRIGARAVLPALENNEVRDYMEVRLRSCGGEVGRLFNRRATREIARRSTGIPRRINVLCSNAMLVAHSRGSTRVERSHVREAAQDYDPPLANLKSLPRMAHLGAWATGSAVAALALALLGLAFFRPPRANRANESRDRRSVQAGYPVRQKSRTGATNVARDNLRRQIMKPVSTGSRHGGVETSMLLHTGEGELNGPVQASTSARSPLQARSQPGSQIMLTLVNVAKKSAVGKTDTSATSVSPSTHRPVSESNKTELVKPGRSGALAVRGYISSPATETRHGLEGPLMVNSGSLSSAPVPATHERHHRAPRTIANASHADVVSPEIIDGDAAMGEGKYDRALRNYLAALALDPSNEVISGKIKRAHSAGRAEKEILQ